MIFLIINQVNVLGYQTSVIINGFAVLTTKQMLCSWSMQVYLYLLENIILFQVLISKTLIFYSSVQIKTNNKNMT